MSSAASRPTYESAEDRGHETRIADAIGRAWRCVARKLPKQYRLDFGLYRDERLVAFLEVKRRAAYSIADLDRLGGLLLSLGKYVAARELCSTAEVRFLLAIETKDGIRVAIFEHFADTPDVRFGGRRDRGDWQDVEPVVLIPISRFSHEIPE